MRHHAGIDVDQETFAAALVSCGYRIRRCERRDGVLIADGLLCDASRRALELWR